MKTRRYRLMASRACPWCRRVLTVRYLLGLTEAIPTSWGYGKGADEYWELTGPDGKPGVDPILGACSLAEVYEKTPGYAPPPIVPALMGTITGRVISDDSSGLLFDLSTAQWDLHRKGIPDLHLLSRHSSTNAWDVWIGSQINVGHAVVAHSRDPEKAAVTANGILVGFDVIDTLLARATRMEAFRGDSLAMPDEPALSTVVAIGQCLCGDRPTGNNTRLFTTVQSYEYGGRQHYPGEKAPSISFWPTLARWLRALESRSGWAGPEERNAFDC